MSEPERDPRVYFAAERTFLAWIRTGLSLMGFGFVVARFGLFLREVGLSGASQPHLGGFSRWFGLALVVLGVAVTAGAAVSHVLTVRRLQRGEPFVGRATALGLIVAVMLVLVGAAMTVYLFDAA